MENLKNRDNKERNQGHGDQEGTRMGARERSGSTNGGFGKSRGPREEGEHRAKYRKHRFDGPKRDAIATTVDRYVVIVFRMERNTIEVYPGTTFPEALRRNTERNNMDTAELPDCNDCK